MDKHVNVGTEGHIDHGKQLPQVLIVGGVSKSFEGAYKALLEMEKRGEVEIVYEDVGKGINGKGEDFWVDPDQDGIQTSTDLLKQFMSSLSFHQGHYDNTDNKHKHPHWHKGRW